MLFQASITIPANTPASAPTTAILKIAHGIISEFMVCPRQGHAGLAHCVILHHEHQIAPSTAGMSLFGDSYPIDWGEYYEVYQPPYELKIVGWNDDDSYEHTFDIFVAVLPRKGIIATAVSDALSSILGIFSPKRIFGG
ncbi:MAG: hypothetical protein A2Y89_06725 [Chloroflexi bacterium RBG_13_51_18]|nr:MAG: hypothetical protein A2Y89_06725 [Chloroflexi bacterium RBG_13_51_18]